jgi:hypothetical protein
MIFTPSPANRIAGGLLLMIIGTLAGAAVGQDELKRVTARLLTPPTLKPAGGFTARVLVQPGNVYDPLWMLQRGNTIWLNDDGGEEGDKGSRLLTVDRRGGLTVVAGIGKLLPVTGYDFAPPSYGPLSGQIYSLAQPQTTDRGTYVNHIIQRIDPAKDYATTIVCTLPNAGQANKGIAGLGLDARFGPANGPFADKFFAVTGYNNTIYQVTADGACRPFVSFDGTKFTSPFAIAFTRDGNTMLVTGRVAGGAAGKAGAIARVSGDGKLQEGFLGEGMDRPTGLDLAPQGFGSYADQWFVADLGSGQVPMTQRLPADGRVFRITPDGVAHLVATGFMNPIGVRFIDQRLLWVSDINGDFIAGKRELPEGFIAELRAQ